MKGVGLGYLSYIGDNNEIIPPVYANLDATYWNRNLWWPDLIIKYFDTEAKVTSPPYYGSTGLSVCFQPSDGNYTRMLDYSGPRTGPVFSKRMHCPAQKNLDDTHYYTNVMWYNQCYY